MRTLILMRGAPGSGKDYFIDQHKLRPYTLSADDIRLQVQSPILNTNGEFSICQKNDKQVWKMLFNMLIERMERGDFIVVNATHSKESDFHKYRELCDKYRYRIQYVQIDTPLEVALTQNKKRGGCKLVPEHVIENIHTRIQTQVPPKYVKRIAVEDFAEAIKVKPIDIAPEYKKCLVIGDIHGCYDALMSLIGKDGIRDDTFYVFVGDYLDRGLQNKEVLVWLLENYHHKNVLLLEGNHERHLRQWSEGRTWEIASSEFLENTMLQLEADGGLDLKQVRQVVRKLGQMAYFNFGTMTYFVSHGGISTLPENLMLLSTAQLIKGVGGYKDVDSVAETWLKTTPASCISMAGHRNVQDYDFFVNDRYVCLEGKVEFGGHLRAVELGRDDTIKTIAIKNNVFSSTGRERTTPVANVENSQVATIAQLRGNRDVVEKVFGYVSSFSFTREVFARASWSSINIKARGLFVNNTTDEVIARSYEKFFNVNERIDTKIDSLVKNSVYPLTCWEKYNGFLGLLGYDAQTDDLFFASKNSPVSDHAHWFKQIFQRNHADKLANIKEHLKSNNTCWVFEVIDPINDPHIIKYDHQEAILLDEFKRTTALARSSYTDLMALAIKFNLAIKQEYTETIDTPQGLLEFLTRSSYSDEDFVEGCVLEDAAGKMFKLKFPYYKKWKHMRALKETLQRGHTPRLGALLTPQANNFYAFLKRKDKEELTEKSIIELRSEFNTQS